MSLIKISTRINRLTQWPQQKNLMIFIEKTFAYYLFMKKIGLESKKYNKMNQFLAPP